MCGFVGLLGPDFPERGSCIRRMLDCIAHRGPDGEGIFENESIALGHRRLAIFDTSDHAAQPMQHRESQQVLAFNGAIYNYPELSRSLKEAPHSSGDTEVLLRLLVEQSETALTQLNGMWAFAHWDPKRQRLLLCRDRLGVKPLYWLHWGQHLAFASEPGALLALDNETPQINPAVMASFLAERSVDHSSDTFFKGIQQLPPGTLLECHADDTKIHLSQRHYWRLPEASATPSSSAPLIELLDDAVQLRQRSDVPLAYLLSGGLDSSSIVASAALATPGQPLRAYTLSYDDPRDESHYARAVADHLPNVELHSIAPNADDFANYLTTLLRAQGEPFSDGSMLAHYLIMQRIAADGYKVAVGGLGGDEALAGYIGPYSRALAADQIVSGQIRGAWQTVGKQTKSLLSCAVHLPPPQLRNYLRKRLTQHQLCDWIKPDFIAQMVNRYPTQEPDGRLHSYLRAGIQQWALPGFVHYEDRNAMAHGLESRAPFLDYRIIEWGLTRKPEQLIGDGLGKLPLRQAIKNRLPAMVVNRRDKQGLPAPANHWLKAHPQLFRETLMQAKALHQWVDVKRICSDFEQTLQNEKSLPETRSATLWRVFIASAWANEFKVSE